MQNFLEIAKTDFTDTFSGAWIFPMLLIGILWILWQEKDWMRKILLGILPLVFLFFYWCPLTGLFFMKVLGENVYWRILWLLLLAVIIPYAGCLLLKRLSGIWRQGAFLLLLAVIGLGGKSVLSSEWFETATNDYKVPENVMQIADLLPENVHVVASNRLTPYLRLRDPSLTLEYARNALVFNGMDVVYGPTANLYKELQKEEIDVNVAGPLAREEKCTFIIISKSLIYNGDWADYGYLSYHDTDEFTILVDENYEEGMDTRKWEE